MKIILFGYRGSGKTSLGQRLARRISAVFYDTDALVCERFGGLNVAKIWAMHGEPAFRAMEVEVTKDLLAAPSIKHQVIALGGGTLMQPEALRAVKAARDVLRVYLRAPASVLAERIASDRATAGQRPSLTGAKSSVDEVAEVLALREPIYLEAADKTLNVSERSIEDAANRICSWMRGEHHE